MLDAWAYARGVTLRFIRPGRPIENGCVEGGRSETPFFQSTPDEQPIQQLQLERIAGGGRV